MEPGGATSSSFLQAVADGKPLSSHGRHAAPSLQRGQACTTCRARKVKCDGLKPACTACIRSARAHGDKVEDVVCNYESGRPRKRSRTANADAQPILIDSSLPPPVASSSSGFGSVSRVEQLEQRIHELESQLGGGRYTPLPQQQQHHQHQHHGHHQQSPFDLPTPRAVSAFPPHSLEALLEATNDPMLATASIQEVPMVPADNERFSNTTLDPSLSQLLGGVWPSSLPRLHIVLKLIDGWLTRTREWDGLFNKNKLLASLRLSSDDPSFPAQGLIHAMLAEATLTASPSIYEGEKYWASFPSASAYHDEMAMSLLQQDIAHGKNILQVVQALTLLCHRAYSEAQYVKVWTLCGLVTRLCPPADLNHVQAYAASPSAPYEQRLVKRTVSLLVPTEDPIELEERCATFWAAFMCDRLATASTGWAPSLDEADITTPLPSRDGSIPDGNPTLSPLNISNPNFLISHPTRLVGPRQLLTKAVILIGRVALFLARSPAPIGRGLPNAQAVGDYRDSPGFRKMESDVVNFRMSIPGEFRLLSAKVRADDFYCLPLNAIPAVCIILLHEPFCTGAERDDDSFEQSIKAARSVLSGLHTIHNASFDIGCITPFALYLWAVAGRTLVRELAIRQMHGNYDGIDSLRIDIELIITSMRAHRTPLGQNCAMQLESLYDDPDVCLPRPLVERSEISGYGLPEQMQAARRPRGMAGSNMPATSIDWANFLAPF